MSRMGDGNLLERLDDWHHRTGFPGSWIFCDLWDAYVTREFGSILGARALYLKSFWKRSR